MLPSYSCLPMLRSIESRGVILIRLGQFEPVHLSTINFIRNCYKDIGHVNVCLIRSYHFCLQLVTVIGWAVAAALGMWLVYGPHKYIEKGAEEWPLAGRVAYGMFERLLWGLVLAWVTYACHFGGGGIVIYFIMYTDLETKLD